MSSIGGYSPTVTAQAYRQPNPQGYAASQGSATGPVPKANSRYIPVLFELSLLALGTFFAIRSFRNGGKVAQMFESMKSPFIRAGEFIKEKIPFLNRRTAQATDAVVTAPVEGATIATA